VGILIFLGWLYLLLMVWRTLGIVNEIKQQKKRFERYYNYNPTTREEFKKVCIANGMLFSDYEEFEEHTHDGEEEIYYYINKKDGDWTVVL